MGRAWDAPVRDYLSRALFSVRSDTPLAEVQALLEERDVSSAPVIDDGVLRGILSTTDLLRKARTELHPHANDARLEHAGIVSPSRRAEDLMCREVVTIDESAPLVEAARLMTGHRIHRLVVVRGASPVGIVSTRDAMRAVLEERVATPLSTLMSAPVSTVDMGDSIETAILKLDDANVRGLVVVDERWPIGVFTHTEALHGRALPPDLRQMPVERAMSYETICLDVGTPLYRVCGYAMKMRTRRILAVERRELVGILTGLDVMRAMQ